jgi:hypothetical protein
MTRLSELGYSPLTGLGRRYAARRAARGPYVASNDQAATAALPADQTAPPPLPADMPRPWLAWRAFPQYCRNRKD